MSGVRSEEDGRRGREREPYCSDAGNSPETTSDKHTDLPGALWREPITRVCTCQRQNRHTRTLDVHAAILESPEEKRMQETRTTLNELQERIDHILRRL